MKEGSDYLQTEVTNNSKMPLKVADAKLLHIFEWKQEKQRLLEDRNKLIMDRLNKRMKLSSELRNQTMIEEVQYKAKQITGDHLKKWEKKVASLRELEQKSTQNFLEEQLRRKDGAISKEVSPVKDSPNKRLRELDEQKQRDMSQMEDQEVREAESRLRFIEIRQYLKQQRHAQNLEERLSPVKSRNSDVTKRFETMKELIREREIQNMSTFVKREKRRVKAIEKRNDSLSQSMWTDDPYLQLKEELKKRREKYSILGRESVERPRVGEGLQDLSLLSSIEGRIQKATNNKQNQAQTLERQVQLKRELERLKQEEIEELKYIQKQQLNLVKEQIIKRNRERDERVKELRNSLERRANESYNSQLRANREREMILLK